MGQTYPPLKTVTIAYDNAATQAELTKALTRRGYTVVATVSSQGDILGTLQTVKSQLLLLPFEQATPDRIQLLQTIVALRSTAIVVLMKEWDAHLAKRAMEAGVSGYMVRPFDESHASAILESSWHHFQKLMDLQENLELRKLLEKAKGIVMKERFISEEEAHQLILKLSQDLSIPLKEVCQAIVQTKILPGDKLKK